PVSDAAGAGTPGSLADALDDAEEGLGEEVGRTGVVVEGGLPATLTSARDAVAAVPPMVPVAVLLALVCCLIVLSQFARLVAVARMPEHTLLRAGGASLPQFARAALLEAALLTAPAIALGVGAGHLLAVVLAPGDASVPVWIPLSVGVVAW